jgi:hypothetical protein
MNGTQGRLPSPWKRARYWATLALGLTTTAGLLLLANGHLMLGALTLLAALLLVKSSVFGRRAKRIHHDSAPATSATAAPHRSKLRKAA